MGPQGASSSSGACWGVCPLRCFLTAGRGPKTASFVGITWRRSGCQGADLAALRGPPAALMGVTQPIRIAVIASQTIKRQINKVVGPWSGEAYNWVKWAAREMLTTDHLGGKKKNPTTWSALLWRNQTHAEATFQPCLFTVVNRLLSITAIISKCIYIYKIYFRYVNMQLLLRFTWAMHIIHYQLIVL